MSLLPRPYTYSKYENLLKHFEKHESIVVDCAQTKF